MTTDGVQSGMRAWYLPTTDKAGELFIAEVGSGLGEPIVVLHGGPGGDLRYLLPIARGLEGLPFVFYDQRGSLLSRVIPDSITMPKHVEDLEQLREALHATRLRLVSHSAGTLLAFAYLQAHPDRVANLVLVGALPHKNGRPYYDAEYAALWRGLGDTATQFAARPAVRAALQAAGVDTSPLPPRLAATRGHILQAGAEMVHVERWQQGLPYRVNPEAARRTRATTEFTYDVGPLLARHPFRVTVINGEFDYTVGPRGSPLWRRLTETVAPHVRLVVIPDASHLVWRDAPDAFRTALREALGPQ
jgi:pimeloyl-ACP methyl ester carboxylesterase